jgi:hypothetical protein
MNCTEFEIAAESAVETRNPLIAAAIEHLSTCAECRHSWELQQQLNAVIEAWQTVQPSAGLADSVLAELAAPGGGVGRDSFKERDLKDAEEKRDQGQELSGMWDERPCSSTSASIENRAGAINLAGPGTGPVYPATMGPNQKTRSAAFAIAAVAACMVVAALFATRFDVNGRDDLAEIPHPKTTEVAKTDVPLDLSSTLNEVFSDLKTEYHEMASETKAMAREMVIALPHRVDAVAVPDSENVELLPNSSDMVRMLEPIGSRVESAFGFLWNAIPSELPSG